MLIVVCFRIVLLTHHIKPTAQSRTASRVERMSTPNLNLLPGELLEMVFLVLDPVSALSLGSCSIRLQGLVSQPFIFEMVLNKVKFDVKKNDEEEAEEEERMADNEELIRKIMNFIAKHPDPEPLATILQDMITKQFPDRGGPRWKEMMTLGRTPHHPLSVNVEGLLLLSQAKTGLRLGTCQVGMGSGKIISGALLVALSSLADEMWGVELEAFYLDCSTEEEGAALAHLLACCSSWSLDNLSLSGGVGEGVWAGLARRRGKVGVANLEVDVVRRGRLEDVRNVWESTEVGWSVGREAVWKRGGLEEGWSKIVEWRESREDSWLSDEEDEDSWLSDEEDEDGDMDDIDDTFIDQDLAPCSSKRDHDSTQDTVHLALYGFLVLLTYLCF